MPEKFEAKFLGILGFGKDESAWISEYDSWPVGGGFRSDFTLVGRGVVTSDHCGKHMCYRVCTRDQLHDGVCKGKDYYFNQVMSCHKPSCPRCWKYGWAVREARSIDSRFSTAEKVLGLPLLMSSICLPLFHERIMVCHMRFCGEMLSRL